MDDQSNTNSSSSLTGVVGSVNNSNVAGVVHGNVGDTNTVVQNADTIQNIIVGQQRRDNVLILKEERERVAIYWQQIFRKRKQDYILCDYTAPNGDIVPVFIQHNYSISQELPLDYHLQYGMQNGIQFFVYHDKEQRPFQHRFMVNNVQRYASDAIQSILPGVDLGWIAGDYLHDMK